MRDPDRQLVRLAKTGNKAAFGKLARTYRDTVLALTFDFLQDYESAKDAAQEVFIKAFKNIGDFEERAKFSSWIYRIAVNTCLDVQKKEKYRKKQEPITKEHEYVTEIATNSASGMGIDDTMIIALERLSPNQRTVIVLRYFHDKEIAEIAEIIDCNQGTVRIHLHRAIKNLDRFFK
jgi:RNA polymerase sigma-70 factor (ECF subfamily)